MYSLDDMSVGTVHRVIEHNKEVHDFYGIDFDQIWSYIYMYMYIECIFGEYLLSRRMGGSLRYSI